VIEYLSRSIGGMPWFSLMKVAQGPMSLPRAFGLRVPFPMERKRRTLNRLAAELRLKQKPNVARSVAPDLVVTADMGL
jgi:hypothetical protein